LLGELFDQPRGRFTEHTRLTADITLPDLTRDSFIDLYPLLPYQIAADTSSRPFSRSYGDISMVTRSPASVLMRFLFILPAVYATTAWPTSS
jgi:hypothetical protein